MDLRYVLVIIGITNRVPLKLLELLITKFRIMQNLNNNSGENPENGKVLLFTVDGKEYKWNDEYIFGHEIRTIAGAPAESPESKLFLAVARPWEDELIENTTRVNLARPEIEHFYLKNILLLIINSKEYTWDKEYITGAEIKQLAGIALGDELFLSIRKPWEDELILNETRVNLARPGIESFYSKTNSNINLTIQTAKGSWTDSFSKSLTVQALIQAVITHFGFAADGNYQLKLKGTTDNLEPSRTIGSYNLPDGQILVFTDLGKGA